MDKQTDTEVSDESDVANSNGAVATAVRDAEKDISVIIKQLGDRLGGQRIGYVPWLMKFEPQ